ncbi:hypothetical protein EJ110_NYTH20778 [Nymphaea thermarum]|nr:hypothetical protein EJ110_NYTH20778 [Nymphaea thermarum]
MCLKEECHTRHLLALSLGSMASKFFHVSKNLHLGREDDDDSNGDGFRWPSLWLNLQFYSLMDEDQDWELWVDETMIGFWPRSNYRTRNANKIVWVGEILNKRTRGRHTSTQMGNGHFSSEPIGRVAYISHMALYDLNLDRYDAPEAINMYIPNPDCYDLKYCPSDDEYGQHITFEASYWWSEEGGAFRSIPVMVFIAVDDGDIYDCMKLGSHPQKRNPSILRKIQSRGKPSLHGTITTANNSDHESMRNRRRKAGAFKKNDGFNSWLYNDNYRIPANNGLRFSRVDNYMPFGTQLDCSTIGGDNTELEIMIKQDEDQDWGLWVDDTMIGYWPKSRYRNSFANKIIWGGEIVNKRTRGRHTSTQMGNGRFSSEQIGRVAYVRNMGLYDLDLDRYDAPEEIDVQVTEPDCYDLRYLHSDYDDDDDDDDGYRQHITFEFQPKQSTSPSTQEGFGICSKIPAEAIGIPFIAWTKIKTANCVIWGGEVLNQLTRGRHMSTQMGNGHFSSEPIGGERREHSKKYAAHQEVFLVLKATKAGPLNFSAIESFASLRARSFLKSETTKLQVDDDPTSRHEDEDQDWGLWVDETMIGFWPKSNYRKHYANKISWGGEIVNKRTRGRHTFTQMGNGHFSSEPLGRVAYISNMAIYDLDLDCYDAPEEIDVYVPQPDCYDLEYYQSDDDGDYGQHITFGGPGYDIIKCP